MLTTDDVFPVYQVGQYWAILNPLGLLLINQLPAYTVSPGKDYSVSLWRLGESTTPSEWNYVGIPEGTVYLHFKQEVFTPRWEHYTGEVRLCSGPERKLFFILLEGKKTYVLSDWKLDASDYDSSTLFQSGPRLTNPECESTRLDRVLRD